MKYILFVWGFLCCFGPAVFAQQDQKALLRAIRESSDTTRIRAYIEYGFWFESTNLDSAAKYYLKAGQLAKQLHNIDGLMDYYGNYTYVLNQQGKLKLSRELNLEALVIARKSKDPLRIATCLFNTGSSYNNSGKYEQAVHYYIQAARLFEQMHMDREMVIVNDNIGGIFTNIGQADKALPYSRKALTNARKLGDSVLLTKTLINSALAEVQLYQLPAARNNALAGLHLARATNHPDLEGAALNALADVRFKERHPVSGLRLSHASLELARQIESKYNEMEALRLLAGGYLQTQQYDSALVYAHAAIAFGNAYQFRSYHASLYDIIATAAAGKNDFRQAFEAQSQSAHLKDSIHRTELEQKIRQLEARYQSVKSQHHISDLERSTNQQQFLILTLGAALLVLVLLALLIYTNIQRKKRTAERILLAKEKELLELEKEQQLLATESILKGQEEERSRLARDLHDGLGGLLSGIKLTLVHSGEASAAEGQSRALEQLDYAISEMRRIAHSMMPEALVRFGLPDALGDFCSTFTHHDQLKVHLQVFGMEKRLGQNIEIALYRIAQELINNAIRHGKATEIFVQLMRNEALVSLTVEDNGSGFDPSAIRQQEGMGLINIRSRVELLHGTLDLQSETGVGTTVNIDIHLKDHD